LPALVFIAVTARSTHRTVSAHKPRSKISARNNHRLRRAKESHPEVVGRQGILVGLVGTQLR
jgi:hypothetical protein